MSTRIWRGDALAVAQVDKLALSGTWEVGDELSFTINGKELLVVAGSTSEADIVEQVADAWNALDIAEFAEITASFDGDDLFLTGDTAGVPFTVIIATTESGGGAADAQVATHTTETDATGPNFWDNPANWSGNAVPIAADDVFLRNSDVSILYGLGQSAVTLATMVIGADYTGQIGLPRINQLGYFEYRADYLAISVTLLTIGDGDGAGSGRLKINVGSVACTLNCRKTASGLESGLEALLWKGTHVTNVVNISKGSVGIAVLPGETAVVATLRVDFQDSQASDAQVRCGSGVTLTTITKTGGRLETNSNITTLNTRENSGEVHHLAGTLGTWTGEGGTLFYRSTGTLTTVDNSGVLDFRRDGRARTVTNCTLRRGCSLFDPNKTVTFSNPIALGVGVGLEDVTLDVGAGRTLAVA